MRVVSLVALFVVGLLCAEVSESRARTPRSPGPNAVWVPGHFGSDGEWIRGFYRDVTQPSMMWIDAHVDAFGVRVPAHWVKAMPPVAHRMVFVPGHRRDDGGYEPGFWRRPVRVGFRWEAGRYDRSRRWHTGHWVPLERRRDARWVVGHVDPVSRMWNMGFWRAASRRGFTWVDGRPCPAGYRAGYWRPQGGGGAERRHELRVRTIIRSGPNVRSMTRHTGQRRVHRVKPIHPPIDAPIILNRLHAATLWSTSPCDDNPH